MYNEKVVSYDCLSRVETVLFEVDELIRKSQASNREVSIYKEENVNENNTMTTKFVLVDTPYKINKPQKLSEHQNISNK